MEVLFHGIFTIIKLAILGSIYATILLIVFRLVAKLKQDSWANKVSKKKIRFWFLSGATCSILLVIIANTHWGSHGLGDFATIPLRHGQNVNQINGTQAFIRVQYQYGELQIGDFAKTSTYLVGETEVSTVDDPEDYFAWNLNSNEVEYFSTKEEYITFADKNNLPSPSEFKSFWEHYQDYWGGWRFWTLL